MIQICRLSGGALCFGVTAVTASIPGSALGVTRRVPSEFSTINNALDLSAVGDTVLVAPGVYTDYEVRGGSFPNVSCAFLTDGAILRSESGPESTIIDMQEFEMIGQENVIYGRELMSGTTLVEGFTVTGVAPGNEAVIVANGKNVTFRDCIIRDVTGATTGGIGGVDNDVDIYDCRFTNCRGGASGGVFVNDARLYLEGCTFIDNPSRPIVMTGEPGFNSFRFEMVDCLFIRNSNPAVGEGAVVVSNIWDGAIMRGCYFEQNFGGGSGGAIQIGQCRNIVVENCVFWKNSTIAPPSSGGAIAIGSVYGGIVRGCTFSDNSGGPENPLAGASIQLSSGSFELHNNVIANSGLGGAAIYLFSGTVDSQCNVFWNNLGGEAYGFPLSTTDRIVDPEFCDATSGDFTVAVTSPCLPPNSLGCGLIGPLGQGCGTISIEPKSWGKIKGAYR